MIETNRDVFTIHCDFCKNSESFNTDGSWSEMIEQSKDLGWRSFKEGLEWKNKCPDCMEEFIEGLKNKQELFDDNSY